MTLADRPSMVLRDHRVAFSLIVVLLTTHFVFRDVRQPFAFNHKVHISKAGMNCKDCHVNVETKAAASIPSLEVCQTCHSGDPISDSPKEKELLRYIVEKKEISWVRVYRVPDHVYFSHRRHVVRGEEKCTTCHGNVGEMSEPVSSPAIPVTMNNCLDCHRQKKISSDCLACHR